MFDFINNRVLWTEGMLLTPQHFQQQDRFVDYLIQGKYALLQKYFWGVKAIKFSQESLLIGKIRLLSCMAVFPNGVFYNAPDIDSLPIDVQIKKTMVEQTVYLEISSHKTSPYTSISCNVLSIEKNKQNPMRLSLGQLTARLLVKNNLKSNRLALPIARIKAVDSKGSVILSKHFIPPCLDYRISVELNNYLERLGFIIKKSLKNYIHRAKYNSDSIFNKAQTGMLVQSLNRFNVFLQVANNIMIHPSQLYFNLMNFLSDLTLHDTSENYFIENHSYQHNQLDLMFYPIFEKIFKLLERILRTRAIRTPLILKEKNIWVSEKPIPSLNSIKTLILSVHSLTNLKKIKEIIIREIRIAFLNDIYHLICHALHGISITFLKNLPIDLIRDENTIYFALEIKNKDCSLAQPIACYFNTAINDIEMAFWHIQ